MDHGTPWLGLRNEKIKSCPLWHPIGHGTDGTPVATPLPRLGLAFEMRKYKVAPYGTPLAMARMVPLLPPRWPLAREATS